MTYMTHSELLWRSKLHQSGTTRTVMSQLIDWQKMNHLSLDIWEIISVICQAEMLNYHCFQLLKLWEFAGFNFYIL